MSIEEVKELLPALPAEYKGKAYRATTNGRKLEFCQVYIPELNMQAEFSWQAVTRAANNGTTLKF